MICSNCSHHNPADSVFCEKCGESLVLSKATRDKESGSAMGQLDDVMFTPKEKGHKLRDGAIVFFCLLAIGIIFLAFLGSNNTGSTETPTPADTNSVPVTTETPTPQPATFPISYLTIENYKMDWVDQQLNFMGTLKNGYNKGAKNIIVRIDMYKDKALSKLFDTRYVTIVGVPDKGAFSFQVPVYASPQGQFWWTNVITGADFP